MPIAFSPPPLPSPQLQPPAKTGADSGSDDRSAATDAPSRFADLLLAAAHPRSSAPTPGTPRPADAKDDKTTDDKAMDTSAAVVANPLWLPGMTAPAMPTPPVPSAASALPGGTQDGNGTAAIAVAAATRGLAASTQSTPVAPRGAPVASAIDAITNGDDRTPATTVAQRNAADDLRNAGGWTALRFPAAADGNAKPIAALAEGSAGDNANAPATPAAGHGTGIVTLAAAPSPDLRAPDRVDTVVAVHVDHPVGTAAWADDVGTKLAHVVSLRHEDVELHVQPAHLGPIDIRISINGDQASVQFVAPHATTRDALENALPVLRELFAQQGLALGDTSIGSRAQDGSAFSAATRDNPPEGGDAERSLAAPASRVTGTLRLLDVFA
jgi:flagellar hook-length control protein FliK